MKPFLIRLSFFGLFILALASLLQLAVQYRTMTLFVHRKGILEETAGVNADLVLFGSSRCWMQLDPRFFDSCFHLKTANLGVNGHPELSMAIVRLKQYLLNNRAPRYAILSIDPYSIAGSETGNTNFTLKDKFAAYCFLPEKQNMPIVDYFQFNWQERYIPLYAAFKYGLTQHFFSKRNLAPHLQLGYEVYSEEWDTIANPVTHRKPTATEKEKMQLTAALKDLRDLCAANNIRLLCLQTPIHCSFYDSAAFSGTSRLCGGLGLPFVDAAADSVIDNIHLFYNANHLNRKGMAIMNDALCRNKVLGAFLGKN